jgi:cobalt/nickel transport system ATP-binding protein
MSEKEYSSIAISLDNIRFVYPDQTTAIDGLSFRVSQGEKVALIGPNAAGKSTLIMLLNGVLKGEGEIKIFGTKLTRKSDKTIKSKIGIVFQNPDDQLFCPSVYEDVAFGPLNFSVPKEKVDQRVKSALNEVGLQGYEKRSSLHLSYGEKKLASIATVLSSNPDIIALDEPTSNLDPYHRRKIIEWIRKSNRTVLIATHDLDMVADTVQRVLLLHKGKIKWDGRVENILTNQKLLEDNHLELPLSLQAFPFSDKINGEF